MIPIGTKQTQMIMVDVDIIHCKWYEGLAVICRSVCILDRRWMNGRINGRKDGWGRPMCYMTMMMIITIIIITCQSEYKCVPSIDDNKPLFLIIDKKNLQWHPFEWKRWTKWTNWYPLYSNICFLFHLHQYIDQKCDIGDHIIQTKNKFGTIEYNTIEKKVTNDW